MNAPAYTADDALKYLARRVKTDLEWATDSIGWELAFVPHPGLDFEPQLDGLSDLLDELMKTLGPIVLDWHHYSDGRPVTTKVEVEYGHIFERTWHPNPAVDTPEVITGKRSADPGTPDRGTYEIHIRPPSTVEVVLLPPKPSLRAVPTS
ncbi:hypothetical protein [Nocardia sp. BMG51109]|uniref:hypothetical protein n=1 Tax=Nocardia sp. BMG51109 TaxID=1056816 RepID=UPI0004664BB7|nr:hypothetical protein [Nocardia sp. BMG51109]